MNSETQTVTLPHPEKPCDFNNSHRKESGGFQRELSMLIPGERGEMKAVVCLRTYGTQARNYACLWTHTGTVETSRHGSGYAGGYGYHRTSAACHSAFESAGFILSKCIDGVGDSAMREAVKALAVFLGYPQAMFHEAYA